MKFIPEDWEPIKVEANDSLTVGELVLSRFLADVALGMCDKEDKYLLVSEGQSEEEIRSTATKKYESAMRINWSGRVDPSDLPNFVVESGKGYSYVLRFESRENRHSKVWLDFKGNISKESGSIYYKIKQAVIEKGGNLENIVTTLTEEQKIQEQDEGLSWTAWCDDWVYFPAMYDGLFWVESAPRNPCDIETYPVGGG